MGTHQYGRKPHPQWIVVCVCLGLIGTAFIGASLVDNSGSRTVPLVFHTPEDLPTSEKASEPRPTVTVTRELLGPVRIRRYYSTVTVTPAPLPRKTVTASPHPAPTVTKTVRPSPVPGPTVTVTVTVTATTTEEE